MSTPPSPNAIAPRIPETATVLLCASHMDAAEGEACIDLLTVTDPDHENVLSISFTRTADDRLEFWHSLVSGLPARVGIITVGAGTRSDASGEADEAGSRPSRIVHESVTDPGDLTGLGIAIGAFLDRWAEPPEQTVVCLHSLTPLLQFADRRRVLRFLRVLTGRLRAQGAVAHFHVDPKAHDDRALAQLGQLVDCIVELDDGDYLIRSGSVD